MSEPVRPWDQRPGEPDESYARFLSYRNLGPGRSLALAYAAHGPESDESASGEKAAQKGQKRPAPGNWREESARHGWVDRAGAWDVHTLSTHGDRLAVLWVGVLTRLAEKCAERLADPRFKPKSFAEVAAVANLLAAYLTPDALRAIQRPAAPPGGSKPPDRAHVE